MAGLVMGRNNVLCKGRQIARDGGVHNPHFHAAHTPQDTFASYSKWTGHGTTQKTLAAHDKYGLNKVDVPLPPFADLLKGQLVAPFFVFQVRLG